MNEDDRDGAAIPGRPAAFVGALGVIVRCIGCAVFGAVRVEGGAE